MNNIKKLRKQSGLTQEELASLLKMDRSTIAMWETGKSMPRAAKLPELARLFSCAIDDLFKLGKEV